MGLFSLDFYRERDYHRIIETCLPSSIPLKSRLYAFVLSEERSQPPLHWLPRSVHWVCHPRRLVTILPKLLKTKLLLDCDFYGRGIRFMISALSDSLEVLWLQGRNYNDAMCQDLSKCSRLRNLCLRRAQKITPIGLKALGRLVKMEKLFLFNTAKLSFPGLNCFFASNFECQFKQSLRYLNLSGGSVAQSYNIQESGFIVNDKKQILKEIIYSSCPNVQYVVIEKELSHPKHYSSLDKSHWLMAIDPSLFTTSHSYMHSSLDNN